MSRDEILEIYSILVDRCERFDRKGKTMPYTSANGHMFSQVNKDNELGIRFSKDDQEKYFKKFRTTYFKSYNAIMKGYILVTEEMLIDQELMYQLINDSYDYVMTLKAK